MNYDITLPLVNVKYPGPSKAKTYLSSCLWFYGRGSGSTTFFTYDTTNTFAFGLSSGTLMDSTINGFYSKRCVFAHVGSMLSPYLAELTLLLYISRIENLQILGNFPTATH